MQDVKSAPGTLNATDYRKLFKDFVYFSAVPLIFYLTAVLGVIQLPNHVITLKDFIPGNDTIIVIIAWLLNQVLNALRKYIA